MNEVYEYLNECKVYYLATIKDGKPRIRPFGTIDLFEEKLYIQTGKVKEVSKEMKLNPNVELCAMNKGTWMRMSAKAYLDERVEAQEHMLEKYPSLKKNYQVNDGNTEVFYLEEVVTEIYSFGSDPKIYRF